MVTKNLGNQHLLSYIIQQPGHSCDQKNYMLPYKKLKEP